MLVGLIGSSIVAVCLWLLTIKCMRGCDWILISGPNIMPKEDKIKYKQQHDMIRMNKYLGKMVFIPASIITSMFVIAFALNWDIADWIIGLSAVIMLVLSVPIFIAVFKISGTN